MCKKKSNQNYYKNRERRRRELPEYTITIGNPPAQVSFAVKEESELEEMLKHAESLLRTIGRSMPVVASEPRKPKTGMEHIYQFTLDGRLELIKVPKVGVQALFLALYCYDPDPASIDQLAESTALTRNSLTAFLAQKPYKAYVQKVGESLFRLNHKGKVWVVYEILPSLGVEAPVLENEAAGEG